MRRTGKSKHCVWRWQRRYRLEGVDGCSTTPRVRRAGRRFPTPKLRDVVERLYVNPPEHAVVLSVDEKSQIQALGTHAGATFHEERKTADTHARPPFRSPHYPRWHDDRTEHRAPPAAGIHNRSRHHRRAASFGPGRACHPRQLWHAQDGRCAGLGLATPAKWTFHFTPISSSWLNAVEGFFAKLARRRLAIFKSVAACEAAT